MEYLPLIICAIGQGFSKACSDSIISFKWHSSYWSRFDIDGYFGISNNQKNQQSTDKLFNWLYRNAFVFMSDFWHGANMLQMLFQVAALYFALIMPLQTISPILIVASYWVIRSSVFHIFYTHIFLNKKYSIKSTI